MRLYTLKCPNCDANLEIEDGLNTFYCKHCGCKIILDGQSNATINAKVRIKRMEHEERMQDKQYAHERYVIEQEDKKYKQKHKVFNEKTKREILAWGSIFLVFILLFVFIEVYFGGEDDKSKKEERQLQEIVGEIMEDINSNNFDDAYIKAKSLKYTSGWSSDIEEKWDDTRDALLEKIEEAEKKYNKENGLEEDDKFLGIF